MSNIADIIRKDAATHYSGDPPKPVRRAPNLWRFATLSLAVAFSVGVASNDFLSGALSALAILVGFSFNVLFYLVANRLSRPSSFVSYEHELRFTRLSKLSDEIFDNVSYFNVVAVASAISSLVLLLVGSDEFIKRCTTYSPILASRFNILPVAFGWIGWGVRSLLLAAFIFLLCESIYTFLRCISRVRFYFSMLQVMDDENQELLREREAMAKAAMSKDSAV